MKKDDHTFFVTILKEMDLYLSHIRQFIQCPILTVGGSLTVLANRINRIQGEQLFPSLSVMGLALIRP